MSFEPQSKLLRTLCVSPYKQSAWGTAAALPMAAINRVQRFDGSAVLDLNPSRRSDANMSGKGSHFATNGQITAWDLKVSGVKFEGSGWALGWALAFLLGKDSVAGANSPYTHTMAFDESTRQAIPTTLFLQDTTDLVYFVPDMSISKLTITIPDTGSIQVEADMVGTGYLNSLSGAALTAALGALPQVPSENYVLGSDANFLMGNVGAVASVNGRNRTTTITLDWQTTPYRGTGTGLQASFNRKGAPKFSLSSTIAAQTPDDIFTRMFNNTQTAIQIAANSGATAQFGVNLPQANLKTAKMGFEDDMTIWNVEADETTCYQAAGTPPITFSVVNEQPSYLTAYSGS